MDYQRAKTFILNKLEQELPEDLTYHGLHHTRDVLEASIRLAEQEGVNGHDLLLLKTAALYHDAGFLTTYKEHEEVGCELSVQYLPQYGFSDEEIEKICGMIRATRIPQTPHNLLEEILADADLDYLGRSDFHTIADSLYREFRSREIVKTEQEWFRLQKSFFESHRYFTESAKAMRTAKKEEHYKWICEKLESLEEAA